MSVENQRKIWLKAKEELVEDVNTWNKNQQVVSVPYFDVKDDWADFRRRLELYYFDNGVQNDRQVSVLLTSISETVYDKLKQLCRPEPPIKKSLKQLTALLSKHFGEKPAWRERDKFFKLKQCGEDVCEWFKTVRESAEKCEFGLCLDEHIRNRFVCGMRAGSVQDRLFQQELNSSCSSLVEIALQNSGEALASAMTPNRDNKHLSNALHSFLPRRSPRKLSWQSNKENYWKPQYSFQTRSPHPPLTNTWGNTGDRDKKRGTKRPHNPDDDDDDDNAPAPSCLCALTTKKLTVRKDCPNQGRGFFICPKEENKCSFYMWADEVDLQIQCFCPLAARKMTVRKDGPNKGRQFYGCPKNHGDSSRCQFFVWVDDAESGNYKSGANSEGGGVGRGGFASGSRSSSSGRGRGAKSAPSPAKKPKPSPKPSSSNFRATGGKEPAKVRKCGVCGQPGHNRKNCPQNAG